MRLIPRGEVEAERKAGRLGGDFEFAPQRGTPYGLVRRLLLGPKTLLPCTPPPWGTLAAVKVATGEIAWQVPLGQFPGTEKVPQAAEWGSIALGGPIVTAGGLVFTAGTLEAAIYAFDVRTGKQLWKGPLPTSARSTPDDLPWPQRAAIRHHLRGGPWRANRPAARGLRCGVRAS